MSDASAEPNSVTTRYGYDLATLGGTVQRFNRGSYLAMAAAAIGLAAVLATHPTKNWANEFLLPFVAAVGIGFVAFLLAAIGARLLQQLTSSTIHPLTDAITVTVFTLLGLYVTSLLLTTPVALLSALFGVVVATAAPMAIASAPVNAILRDTPTAEHVAAQAQQHPAWATLLGGSARWVLTGIIADLVLRLGVLVILWHHREWFLWVLIVVVADAILSARGLTSSSRMLWLAPSIITALGAATVVTYLALAG